MNRLQGQLEQFEISLPTYHSIYNPGCFFLGILRSWIIVIPHILGSTIPYDYQPSFISYIHSYPHIFMVKMPFELPGWWF